ncbi:MAG TPA: site-2 protease family protein [Thermoanaerobaculia bacterium]|nr:site-2 protease family protein [Thermoanaerobaculia bacterium]
MSDPSPPPLSGAPGSPPHVIDLTRDALGIHGRGRERSRWPLAGLLLTLTFLTTTTLGAHWAITFRTDQLSTLAGPLGIPFLTPRLIAAVWRDPALLATGLTLSLPLLLILLTHELGHFLQCRRYRVAATPPFFLPVPLGFGTLGAFIRVRAPIRTKRALFDIGIAGPIAGFVMLLPFLLVGVARSEPVAIPPTTFEDTPYALMVPGHSLALRLATTWFHGPLPEGTVLNLHPFALAAWFGLLATSLNLLPLGQLDGGHILYAVAGRKQRQLSQALWLGVALMGFYWEGWWVWCGVVLLLGLRHPPVFDEAEPLDPLRRWLAVGAVLILLLSFMPIPFSEIPVPAPEGLALPDPSP